MIPVSCSSETNFRRKPSEEIGANTSSFAPVSLFADEIDEITFRALGIHVAEEERKKG
jgi:hypothetical protein